MIEGREAESDFAERSEESDGRGGERRKRLDSASYYSVQHTPRWPILPSKEESGKLRMQVLVLPYSIGREPLENRYPGQREQKCRSEGNRADWG